MCIGEGFAWEEWGPGKGYVLSSEYLQNSCGKLLAKRDCKNLQACTVCLCALVSSFTSRKAMGWGGGWGVGSCDSQLGNYCRQFNWGNSRQAWARISCKCRASGCIVLPVSSFTSQEGRKGKREGLGVQSSESHLEILLAGRQQWAMGFQYIAVCSISICYAKNGVFIQEIVCVSAKILKGFLQVGLVPISNCVWNLSAWQR